MDSPVTATAKQSGFFKNPQMFLDRGERHGVRAGQLCHPLFASGEMGQDAAPGRIGQGGKSAVQALGIFNHLVKY